MSKRRRKIAKAKLKTHELLTIFSILVFAGILTSSIDPVSTIISIIGLLATFFGFFYVKFKISKRKLNKNRLLISVVFYVVALYISVLAKVVVPFLIIAILIPSSYYAYKWNKQYKKRKRILGSGIFDIDKMAGREFEIYLEELFRKKGCSVERTPASGDFGADLIMNDGTGKTAIQAKRYSDKVGLSAVQEVVGAMAYYSCKSGMVVTNSSFTEPAKKLAASNGIMLWSRDELVKEIIQVQKKTA